jgi:hypothetical protein
MRVNRGRRGCRATLACRLTRLTVTVAVLAASVGCSLTGSAVAATGGTGVSAPATTSTPGSSSPFTQRGMWIWVLSRSDGGNLSSLIADAHRYGIGTLMIKGGDGTSAWSQFSPQLVSTLHANHLRVCAWQYVYGNHPITEAYVGAATVKKDGADCLVIDAESEYQGKYVAAQSYMTRLRDLIGQNFPVALAGFPYVDYHPGFPYSVFLGPGGAQYNTPQMYWADIGTSVDAVYSHTYEFNRIYQRPIYPLGQSFDRPRLGQILRFRQVSRYYAAGGVSWWDWQEATAADWRAVSQPIGGLPGFVADPGLATLGLHAEGDLVVWAQEHLVSAGQQIAIDGSFGPLTQTAVENFQVAEGLPETGLIDQLTWQALLRFAPAHVRWVHHGRRIVATVAGGVHVEPVPKSAKLRAKRDEIASSGGAGWPKR